MDVQGRETVLQVLDVHRALAVQLCMYIDVHRVLAVQLYMLIKDMMPNNCSDLRKTNRSVSAYYVIPMMALHSVGDATVSVRKSVSQSSVCDEEKKVMTDRPQNGPTK